jgi:hypothetical protein
MKKWAIGFGIVTIAGLGFGVVAIASRSCPAGAFCYAPFVAFVSIGLLAVGGLGLIGVLNFSLWGSAKTGPVAKGLAIAFSVMPFIAMILAMTGSWTAGYVALGLAVGILVGILGLFGVWVSVRTRSRRAAHR